MLKVKGLREMPLALLKDDFALTAACAAHSTNQALFQRLPRKAAIGTAWWRWHPPEVSWQAAQIWNGRYLSRAASARRKVCQDGLDTRFEHTVSRHRPKRDS